MLDHDIDAAPALALLTRRDDDPFAALAPPLPATRRSRRRRRPHRRLTARSLGGQETWAAPPVGPNEGILLIVGMYGGNDGFNTLVPFTDSSYYTQHGSLAIPGAETLPLNGRVGPQPTAHGAEAVLGRRPAGDRRGRRLSEPRPQPLQLDGDLDERHPQRDPELGMDRALARRTPARRPRPVHGGVDRLRRAAPHARPAAPGDGGSAGTSGLRRWHGGRGPPDVRRHQVGRHAGRPRSVARRARRARSAIRSTSRRGWHRSCPPIHQTDSSAGSRSPPG